MGPGDDYGDDIATANMEPSAEQPRTRGFVLRVIGEGLFASHTLPASGSIVIGRAGNAEVRIEDVSISRLHARLHVAPFAVEDLGSANGTRVRGRKLKSGERVEVAAGEAIEIGSVMVLVQPSSTSAPARRVWAHGYFEARVEDECARGGAFAVVRFDAENPAQVKALERRLSAALEPSDMLAAYGPAGYEVLLAGAADAEVRRFVADIPGARAGVACHPRDGRTLDALLGHACHAVRGVSDTRAPGGTALKKLRPIVERIAAGSISVLLLGETGVGKEVMAEELHRASPRAQKPLVRINCAAFSESLLESELFGHEKGAFTGATHSKPGLLETAQGGTVFLDEVGEMPPALQAKLLRVLETRQLLRVGGVAPRAIDVRFIGATNRDLELEVAQGRFRKDLFFRLNGISLVIPPLRERRDEIPALAAHFLRAAAPRRARSIAPEAMALLVQYSWPGNVRELRNMMERAALLCDGVAVAAEHLPADKMTAPLHRGDAEPLDADEERDRQRIVEALEQCGGNQSRAAKLLGISRGTLHIRLESYRLPRPRKRSRSG